LLAHLPIEKLVVIEQAVGYILEAADAESHRP
jgi:hypothetical protein